MLVIRNIHRTSETPIGPEQRKPVVLTIGNFDGLHRGHAVLLDQVCRIAQNLGARSALMSFWPSPTQFFSGGKFKSAIMTWRDRLELLKSLKMDEVHILRFDARLAAYSAQEFFQTILCERINAKHLVVGDDFHFGHRRQGSPEWLVKHAPTKGVGVTCVSAQFEDGRRISSSWVRELLVDGDVKTAEHLLGRPYSVLARVRRGDQRGRTWGFPTANLVLSHPPLLRGVFLVEVQLPGLERRLPGIANVGSRPTLAVIDPPISVEVHLLEGMDWNLYDQRIRVYFMEQCREEHRFDSFDALRQQIERDVLWAHKRFQELNAKAN